MKIILSANAEIYFKFKLLRIGVIY